MAEHWSAEESCRAQESTMYYHTMGRNRSSCYHSTPNMSLVPLDNRQYRHYDSQGHNRYSNYDRRSQHYNRPEADHRKYSQTLPHTYNDSGIVVINVLEAFSAKQALEQYMLNTIQEFNGSDGESTLTWLDQVELVAERTGFDLLEVGISKLKGLALHYISTIHKEEGLSWYKFRQHLIEQYSNVPYTPDAMFTYSKILQQDNESTAQYLVRARVLLEHIHCTSKLADISSFGMDNLSLVWVLREACMRIWVAKEQESWRTMDDVF